MYIYYVYQLIDPRNSKPFYVGEGKGNRAKSHLTFSSGCNNPHKDRVIRKIQKLGLVVEIQLVKENLSKHESVNHETELISKIGLNNLTNICANANPPVLYGEANGFYKKRHTDENKKKMGDANRGKDTKSFAGKKSIRTAMKSRWADAEFRSTQIQHLKNRKGEKRSERAIESYKIAAKQRNINMTDKERSERSRKGAETKRIRYAGLKRQLFIDNEGNKRFRYIPETD